MENTPQVGHEPKQNWFVKRIKKYQVITFTFVFLLLYQLIPYLIVYFSDKEDFLERFSMNIWFWAIFIPIIYILQWLFVVWVASKFTKESLKQKFLRHPIATIFLFILYVTNLPYRLAEYSSSGIVTIFETIAYYTFVSFLWWLFICWISSKLFKKQRLKWKWYEKIIEKFFVFMPIAYNLTLGLIVALILSFILFILLTVVFKYSGQDLTILFN